MKREIDFQNLGTIEFKISGLTSEEVALQLSRHGKNEITQTDQQPIREIISDTFQDPMIWFLIIVGIVFIILGETTDAIVLFVAILPLVLMDVFLHWRTKSSLSALKSNLATTSKVIRNGLEIEINAIEIMPGDLVVLKSNDYIPSDGIFIEINGLQIDESALTGEAFPIVKEEARALIQKYKENKRAWVSEKFLAFAGTRVLTGKGKFLVLQTGPQTQYAQIIKSVTMVSHEQTPLQIAISKLVRWLLIAAVFLCLVLAGIRLYQGHGLIDAFLSAATLAIAAIPEEFPVVFSFFLGVGVYRLANKHTLVRRAVSVENIGRINRICTDKTGTITIGQLSLTHIIVGSRDSKEKESLVIKSAQYSSNSKDYDPIDLAIHEYPVDQKIDDSKIIKIFPFTEDRKREVVLVKENSKMMAYTKGAPESILLMSQLSQEELLFWREQTSRYAKEGHKVLASAWREVGFEKEHQDNLLEPLIGFQFAGLMAFEDPPRPEVRAAMKYCEEHNIMVTMLTGDHPDTAAAIGKDIQMSKDSLNVVSAEEEPEKFEKEYLLANPNFLKNVNIIARCKPIQKLRIVEAFKKSGEIVAVTGDGVNDVPALKMADVSIAMGIRGSRSAKEVSHMILTDDNFSTIVSAISEGRILFQNLKKSFEYLILFHIPFILVAAAIPLLGYPILFLPIQIVWLELIIHPSALFAFQEHGTDETKEVSSHFFNPNEVISMLASGIAFSLLLIAFFMFFINKTNDISYARSAVMALLSFWSAGLVLRLVGMKNNVVKSIIFVTVGASVFLIENSFTSKILSLSPLSLKDWLSILLAVIIFSGASRLRFMKFGFFAFFLAFNTNLHSSERIINGTRIYQIQDNKLALTTVSLMKKRDDFHDAVCTGSLIASNVVITSAHCLVDVNPSEIAILFGPTLHTKLSFNDPKLLYSAREFIIHENYQGADDDIALIVLEKNVSEIQRISEIVNPVVLEAADLKINVSGFSTYIDKTSKSLFDSFGINRERNYVERFEFDSFGERLIPLYTKEVFINRVASFDNILGLNQLDGGICPGDSGGPTTINIGNKNYLLGLNTSVVRKFLSNLEDFDCEFQSRSTLIYPYIEWIKKNVPGISLNVKELSRKEIKDNKIPALKLRCLKSIEGIFNYYNDEITFNYFLGKFSEPKCQSLEVDLAFVKKETNKCFKECATFEELESYCEFINLGNIQLRQGVRARCQVGT